MIWQHDSPGTHAHPPRHRGDLPDHDVGGGARDGRQVVMLGYPITGETEPVGELCEIKGVAQRNGTGGARSDWREVKNRDWEHVLQLSTSWPALGRSSTPFFRSDSR